MSRQYGDLDKLRNIPNGSGVRRALLASEAPFRAIVENAAIGVALFVIQLPAKAP